MALADWIFKDRNGNDLTPTLCSDFVAEGSKSLGFTETDIDKGVIIHKQTITDKPISGAVKTYFGAIETTGNYFGAVFKYQDYANYVYVKVGYDDYIAVGERGGSGQWDELEDELGFELENNKWYILEAILDDANNEITLRVKDASENVLCEKTYKNLMPSFWIGKGGGIGLLIDGAPYANKARYDLTKIYYP